MYIEKEASEVQHNFICEAFGCFQGCTGSSSYSMEEELSPSNRPTIAFPVGLALLLLMLFSMTVFFLCCLHWDKIRSFFKSSPPQDHTDFHTDFPQNSPQKPAASATMPKQNQRQSIPVVMPGDDVPKFIAMACPCEPSLIEKVTIVVHKPNSN
ncbi:uncharacterized protein At5g65660 [Ziziphus jujuba]|uniref:Uncharacterized protein At5g65660 n=2 Tax=Ziziphus jujuba TaxID=326968 RepID=A0A6P4A0A6_ZIZJJ|nr:uncharacterized protein At5g65660 [Ziziphus jujuba]